MSQNTFQVYFDSADRARIGQLPSSSTLHYLVCAITRQVFAVLKTQRASDTLRSIAEQCSAHHHPQMNPAKAVQDFQCLVNNAQQNNSLWASMVLHWNRPHINGLFSREDSRTGQAPVNFILSQQWFGLNGRGVYIYADDVWFRRNEEYVRWFEIFQAYLHEIAHMFVTYLAFTYKQNWRALTPPSTMLRFRVDAKPESGWVTEYYLFGGIYTRWDDNSGRLRDFMTGLPAMLNAHGRLATSPDRIVNLARRRGPYDILSRSAFHDYFDAWKRMFKGERFTEPHNPIPKCDQEHFQERVKCIVLEQIFQNGSDPCAVGLVNTVDDAFKAFSEIPDEFVGHLEPSVIWPDLARNRRCINQVIEHKRPSSDSEASVRTGQESIGKLEEDRGCRRRGEGPAAPIDSHATDHRHGLGRAAEHARVETRKHVEDRRGGGNKTNCGQKASARDNATRQQTSERKPKRDTGGRADVRFVVEGKVKTDHRKKDDPRRPVAIGKKAVSSVTERTEKLPTIIEVRTDYTW